jgi:carbon-monoxide dehydrogenase medium subunit
MGRYYRPDSVDEACERLASADGDATIIAGGQTLTLHLRQGLKDPDELIDISEIGGLAHVTDDGDEVVIGTATTYAELHRNAVVAEELPLLASAMDEIAGPQVRNNGTIGGGLCYADPAVDSPPVLMTYDASVTLVGPDGERTLPVEELYTGYYETALEPAEVLTEVRVPKPADRSAGRYRTMTPRQGDYAVAGVAVRLTVDGDGTCETARVGLTNAGDVPKRARAPEAVLEGSALDREAIDEAVAVLDEDLDLIGDEQIPKSYQETVFKRIAKHVVTGVRDDLEADE